MTRFILNARSGKLNARSGRHLRLAVAVALVAIWGPGVTLRRSASGRAAAAMTAAANKWLDGLTPEQRTQATFPNDTEEKVRWNFIPTNMVIPFG